MNLYSNCPWQLSLDMHFTVEIARFAGYPSRNVQTIASSIITRAIRTFSARGIVRYLSFPLLRLCFIVPKIEGILFFLILCLRVYILDILLELL